MGNSQLEELLAQEDYDGLVKLARTRTSRVIRFLSGRLCSADDEGKWRAVRALGAVTGESAIVSTSKGRDLLRRFLWSLNDESGTVPFGVPEAIGEILTRRHEFQEEYLPLLCSMLTQEDMIQTGSIERGVMWAMGRVGAPVADCSPAAVKALQFAVLSHPAEETRDVARWSLEQIEG